MRLSQDGKVYVCDRANGSAWGVVLSHDAAQKFVYVADGANGRARRMPGEFKWVHNIAIDRQGNLYMAEVGFGRRVQKFNLCRSSVDVKFRQAPRARPQARLYKGMHESLRNIPCRS